MHPAKITYPAVRTVQGTHSTTWTAPPFDEPRTIPSLFKFNAERSPEHPVFAYANPTRGERVLRAREVYLAIRRTSQIVTECLGLLSPTTNGPRPVVGILAVSDTISYVTLVVAIILAGGVAFPISTRNSPAAVAHLLTAVGGRAVFVSQDASMRKLIALAEKEMGEERDDLKVLGIPTFEDMYGRSEDEAREADILGEDGTLGMDDVALVLHSSGSSSFPKPIRITHRQYQQWSHVHWYNDVDMCGLRIGVHALPMFHVVGIMVTTAAIGAGATLTGFSPTAFPAVPTPQSVLAASVTSHSDGMVVVPAFLEAWSREPDAVLVLRNFRVIYVGGAPLEKSVGDALVQQGVRIKNACGMTEIGVVAQGSRTSRTAGAPSEAPCEDWEYMELAAIVKGHRAYVEGMPGVFELVIVDWPTWSPCVTNTEVGGIKAYATNDLMEEHPRDPRLFKIYGRADDQIVLSTGEKTNPVPMETLISQHPAVAAAIIFGRGRFQNGVLVQPRTPFDPTNESELEAFRNTIWPTVERANKVAPAHSRIFKEMITTTHAAKPFPLTAKGTPRRQVALDAYATEIDALYARVEASATQADVPPPAIWDVDGVRAYVCTVVLAVMRVEGIKDGDDLFQQGCDSLQATYIRNALMHALRTSAKVSTHAFPTNFVYSHPSIAALSTFVLRVLSGGAADAEVGRAARVGDMQALLKKYTQDFAAPRWKAEDQLAEADGNGFGGETVLITGSTGRLGSHFLAQLLSRNDVRKVYALNRGTRGRERQVEAFGLWSLDQSLLEEDRITFCGADLAKKDLGLEEHMYEELRTSVTAIIHNAWNVDFNLSLASFEPLIMGTRNVINLAIGSFVPRGPRMVFVSSISVLFNHAPLEPARETLTYGPELAVGLGYGESKWVAEQLLARAASATRLCTTVARVGQLSGDTRVGGWGTKEWLPALVRASKILGYAPIRDDTVAWIPVDVAAETILDALRARSLEPVIHITAPHPVSWESVIAPMVAYLDVPLMAEEEWFARYRQAAVSGLQEPAFRLAKLFGMFVGRKVVRLSTERAAAVSDSLSSMRMLGEDDVGRWLKFWVDAGFLQL